MIKKLRQNYQLSNVIARLLFVATYAFFMWQNAISASSIVLEQFDMSQDHTILLSVLTSLLLGVILQFLVPVLCNVFLNIAKIRTVPLAEYTLLAHICFSLFFFVVGLFRIVNIFTPILSVWGDIIIRFIISLACGFLFYKITQKLYFNDVTTPYYFKVFGISFLVLTVVLGVLL